MTTTIGYPYAQKGMVTTVCPDKSALAEYAGRAILLAETEGDETYGWSVTVLDREQMPGLFTLHVNHVDARAFFDRLVASLAAPRSCPACGEWRSCVCYEGDGEMDARFRARLEQLTAPI